MNASGEDIYDPAEKYVTIPETTLSTHTTNLYTTDRTERPSVIKHIIGVTKNTQARTSTYIHTSKNFET
jgi:hypothetical protein